jgi:hypothetical protein
VTESAIAPPATGYRFPSNGLGSRSILNERGRAVAYRTCEPASQVYHVMTGMDRMPALIGERI